MLLKKSILIILGFLILCASGLWAGDTASFVDLGFSPDGKTYMFGQYGVLSPSLKPWADIFVVDVVNNNFVPNGKVSYTQNSPIIAGQDGSGVFYQLVAANSGIANRYGINFQNQGQPLYISRDLYPSERGETIEFRDFLSGRKYEAELVPSITGSGRNIKSSFYINLVSRSLDDNRLLKAYKAGNPHISRPLIASYNIKRVLIDTGGGSVIFVIEMKRYGESGHDIRYMVEALRL
jgi:predicted secreted protein